MGVYCVKLLVILVSVYVFVVFFQQKTDYEVRISDWSSDVCSSDLYVFNDKVVFDEPDGDRLREVVSGQYVIGIPLERIISDTKIGRASCRERVCQYV